MMEPKKQNCNVSVTDDQEESKDTCSDETIRVEDCVDFSEKEKDFGKLDVVWIVVCIASYLLDTSTDIAVAYRHYQDGNVWYCGLTSAFIIIPLLTMTGFSLRWYLLDADLPGIPVVTQFRWTIRIIFLLLQLGPLLRYLDVLYYGMKINRSETPKEKVYSYLQMIYEDTDATLLRLFESFMEAAPQLVLNLYILAINFSEDSYESSTAIIQILSIFASLTSVSWALASYHRALRMSLPDKVNMTWKGTIIQMFWHYFIIASRVLVIGLFASFSPIYMAIVLSGHWIFMTAWIITMKTEFCDTKCEELAYNAVLGIIFIFCYFNPKDSPTRRRYLFYFIFTFVENTILMSMWFHYSPETWFKLSAMFLQFLSFAIGIVFMVIYYLLFHPTGNIHLHFKLKMIKAFSNSHQEKQVDELTAATEFIPIKETTLPTNKIL